MMLGRKSGVVLRLREDREYAFGIHCIAHQLELSFKDAINKNPCCKRLDALLMGLYYMYYTITTAL